MTDKDDYLTDLSYGDWVTEDIWDTLQQNINANRRYRIKGVAGGDDMEYDTTKVIWSTDIYIYFTRESDGAWVYNKINANPTTGITCGNDDLLYVTLNDTSTTVLTVSAADYTAMPTDDTGRILILGAVSNSTFYGNVMGSSGGWKNPAEEDLDMGGYDITNLNDLTLNADGIINVGGGEALITNLKQIRGRSSDNLIRIDGYDGAGNLYIGYDQALNVNVYDGAAGLVAQITSAGAILAIAAIKNQADNSGLYTGAGDDLRLYHNGSHSFIYNGTGNLYIDAVAGSLVVDTGGIFYIRDSDDSDANLLQLNTTARTLVIGSASDTITTGFFGEVQFASGTTYKIESDGDAYFKDLDLSGNGQIDGSITLNGTLKLYDATGPYTSNFAYTFGGDVNGNGVIVQPGGCMILGSGESASGFQSGGSINATAEELYLTSDNSVWLISNMQAGYASRKTLKFDTNGALTIDSCGLLNAGSSPSGTTAMEYNGYFYATRVYNAVYNDYADYWGKLKMGEKPVPGKAYVQYPSGMVGVANKRADKTCIGICSDTYGSAVGKNVGDVPISVAGFVLAYVDRYYPIGTLLVNKEDGTLTKARWWERRRAIAKFMRNEPELIVYDVAVNGRCWVKIL